MAFFNIRQWLDRISEHPNRRTLTNVNDSTDVKTYDLSRAEGTVSVQGTAITAANLNDLEGRIASAFTAVDNAMPEANPAETATESLTKLKVDGTVYEVEGGGGGEPQTGTIEDVAIASFSDGADDVPVSELIVDIEAVQDLHGYDKPWVGGAGKNKLDVEGRTVSTSGATEETIYSESCSIVKNGATLTITSTGAWSKAQLGISGLVEGETYTLSASFSNPSEASVGLAYYSDGWKGTKVSTATSVRLQVSFVYDSSVERVALIANNKATSAGEIVTVSDIQLELGSTATSYEPYSNICPITGHDNGVITVTDNDQITNTYTVDFGQTVYGGYLNVTTGELTITHKNVDLGSLDYSYSSGTQMFVNNSLVYKAPTNTDSMPNAICSHYAPTSWTEGTTDLSLDSIFCMLTSPLQFRIRDTRFTDANAFKTAMSGVMLVYELATPIEIQLTPVQVKTLLGNNNIFADTGNIEKLVYFKTGCEAFASLIEAYSERDGIQTVLLEASEWDTTTNTITVAVAGVTATSNQEILPLLATSAANIANNKALQSANLMDYGQAAGEITLYAENIPSVDLSIRVIVRA